jgi:16S rRNA (cytidine1402-2'-O)-methyltransferase
MLYLVATPIGNLGDFSFRAIETLKSSDYILCEDTRRSRQLLNHFDIQKPLKSYHKFKEMAALSSIITDLQDGKTISLISDAGTPCIADPGSRLVKRCVELGIPVISIPGACAAIVALTSSGLDTDRFQFFGFLPRKAG